MSELCRPYTLNMVEGETVHAGTYVFYPQKQDLLFYVKVMHIVVQFAFALYLNTKHIRFFSKVFKYKTVGYYVFQVFEILPIPLWETLNFETRQIVNMHKQLHNTLKKERKKERKKEQLDYFI